MVSCSVRTLAGRTWWPYSSIPRRAAKPVSCYTKISCHEPRLRTLAGDPAAGGVLLRGSRVRLRPLEREDLPRYQELFSEPEISLHYGGLGVPESLARLQRRFDAGEFDNTDRVLQVVIETE